jgi:hypothetical protein
VSCCRSRILGVRCAHCYFGQATAGEPMSTGAGGVLDPLVLAGFVSGVVEALSIFSLDYCCLHQSSPSCEFHQNAQPTFQCPYLHDEWTKHYDFIYLGITSQSSIAPQYFYCSKMNIVNSGFWQPCRHY